MEPDSLPNGGTAFPCTETNEGCFNPGMTLRDHFAGLAMQALINKAPSGTSFGTSHHETGLNYAGASYAIADAMIETRANS